MPYLLSEWRAHIQEVLGEFQASRDAIARLKVQIDANPAITESEVVRNIARAQTNLEGTYIIRMFAAFEAALRSYDRTLFNDPERDTKASILIDQLGGRSRLKVRSAIREGVHRVRRLRNYWAHDTDEELEPIPIDRVRGLLQSYLDRFPRDWG